MRRTSVPALYALVRRTRHLVDSPLLRAGPSACTPPPLGTKIDRFDNLRERLEQLFFCVIDFTKSILERLAQRGEVGHRDPHLSAVETTKDPNSPAGTLARGGELSRSLKAMKAFQTNWKQKRHRPLHRVVSDRAQGPQSQCHGRSRASVAWLLTEYGGKCQVEDRYPVVWIESAACAGSRLDSMHSLRFELAFLIADHEEQDDRMSASIGSCDGWGGVRLLVVELHGIPESIERPSRTAVSTRKAPGELMESASLADRWWAERLHEAVVRR